MVFHPCNVSCPVKLDLHELGFNAGDFCSLKDLYICDKVLPLDVEDRVKTPLAGSL